MPKDAKEYFTIRSVARRFDIHPQTLRVYEREGLLAPKRSEGNDKKREKALVRMRTGKLCKKE